MNLNLIKIFPMALVSLALAFASCSDDETYDVVGNPNNLVYFNANASNTFECGIMRTEIGDLGTVKASFPVALQRPSEGEIVAKAVVDNSLIDAYNANNGTSYKALPEGIVDISQSEASIEAGQTSSQDTVSVKIDNSDFSKIENGEYLLPVRLEVVSGSGKGSESRGVGYVIVKALETSLVNTTPSDGDLKGTEQTDYANWKCVSATGLNKDEFGGLFTGDSWNRKWNITENTATFTVDLQKEKGITGVGVTCYVMKSLSLSLSTDNASWIDLGTFTLDQLLGKDGYFVVLQGPVPARYVKMTINIEQNQWTEYYRYLSTFSVYAE